MDNKDFVVPQELNFDVVAKVLTEKQIAIIGIVTAVIGGPLFLLLPSDIGKIIAIAVGVATGFALAKMDIEGVILWDYLNLMLTFTREEKVFIVGGLLPVKDIKDGIIELDDGSWSIMYELTGITYDMMGEGSKAVVLQSLVETLYSTEGKISFYALRKRLDVNKELKTIKNVEESSKNKEYFQAYKSMLVRTVKEKSIGTMRYFMVLNGSKDVILKRGVNMQETIDKGGVFRVRRIYSPVVILYEIMNIHRSYYQKIENEEENLL